MRVERQTSFPVALRKLRLSVPVLMGLLMLMLRGASDVRAEAPGKQWRPFDTARPAPRRIEPGKFSLGASPPSDAIVLFDGHSLDEWDGAAAPEWSVDHGELLASNAHHSLLKSRRVFGDVQVHLEFSEPNPPGGKGQRRGNSGVFLMGLYEVQILDSYENSTYSDGALGALYGQQPPLVNAARPPGEWQSYDIVFEAPRFAGHTLISPAYATVLLNGVVLHHHQPFIGETTPEPNPVYAAMTPVGPLALQEHGDSTGKVRFRNIWVRPLGNYDSP